MITSYAGNLMSTHCSQCNKDFSQDLEICPYCSSRLQPAIDPTLETNAQADVNPQDSLENKSFIDPNIGSTPLRRADPLPEKNIFGAVAWFPPLFGALFILFGKNEDTFAVGEAKKAVMFFGLFILSEFVFGQLTQIFFHIIILGTIFDIIYNYLGLVYVIVSIAGASYAFTGKPFQFSTIKEVVSEVIEEI